MSAPHSCECCQWYLDVEQDCGVPLMPAARVEAFLSHPSTANVCSSFLAVPR